MNQLLVNPSSLSGKIRIPPSKSHTLRAILFASLAEGTSYIRNPLSSPDTQAMIQACSLLGAQIEEHAGHLKISGINGKVGKAEDVIQAGNSGIVLRFLSAVAALGSFPVVITGDYSIRHQRPMKHLLSALEQLGAKSISTKQDGFAPVIIQGALKGGIATIEGADSQPVSALLIACSLAEYPSELIVQNPGEKPWVAFTLQWLAQLGITIEHIDFRHYAIQGKAKIRAFDMTMPGDFSSAAFPIVAALITKSELLVDNLDSADIQGDRQLIGVLQKMGANIEETDSGLRIRPCDKLNGIEIDVNDFIDGLPILAVLGCYAHGKTILKNGKVAREKECDRIHCVAKELSKMGAKIEECDDGLVITPSQLKGTIVNGHNDHRLSMALAVAGFGAQGENIVHCADSIKKTYPSFIQDFQLINANIALL